MEVISRLASSVNKFFSIDGRALPVAYDKSSQSYWLISGQKREPYHLILGPVIGHMQHLVLVCPPFVRPTLPPSTWKPRRDVLEPWDDVHIELYNTVV